MKREFLKELGIADGLIEKIMAENGKDIQVEQSKTAQKQGEIDKLSEQLSQANADVQAFKDMNVDEIKKKAQEFEDKFNQSQAELKEARENSIIEKVLSSLDVHDVDVVKSLIKREQLVFKGDGVVGLDEQINELKQNKGFLFKGDNGNSNPSFTSKSKSNSSNIDITKEQFDKMNYFERVNLKNTNEALYNELVKGD